MEHLEIVTPPASEPLTLSEVKTHLRVEITDDDALISLAMSSARERAEAMLRMTIGLTVYDWYLDGFPYAANGYYNRLVRMQGPSPQWLPNGAAILFVPNPPLVSVGSVKYVDSVGILQTVDPSTYVVSTGLGSRIQPIPGNVWPVVRQQIDGVVVRFTAGLADPTTIKSSLKSWMLLAIGHLYEHREEYSDIDLYPLPDTMNALLAPSDPGIYA